MEGPFAWKFWQLSHDSKIYPNRYIGKRISTVKLEDWNFNGGTCRRKGLRGFQQPLRPEVIAASDRTLARWRLMPQQLKAIFLVGYRFCDDWIRTSSRSLPATVRTPSGTQMEYVSRRFDFLRFHFSPKELTVAEKTIERFHARARSGFRSKSARGLPAPPCLRYVRR